MNTVNNPLQEKYYDFLDLLKILPGSFDDTEKEILALPISTAIRVLVHDTKMKKKIFILA